MKVRTVAICGVVMLGASLAACANDPASPMLTSSLSSPGASVAQKAVTAAQTPKTDPACITLASQIDTLRKEGSVSSLEAAAEGKTSSVKIKRTAIAKQAELNKANAEFQARCAIVPQSAQASPVVPPAATQAAAQAATSAATAAAAKQAAAAVAKN